MSIWKKIEDPEDVEISEDDSTIDICFATTDQGNEYLEIPIEFIENAIKSKKNLNHDVSKFYDEFFGNGYWEKEYKAQIVIFVEQCINNLFNHD